MNDELIPEHIHRDDAEIVVTWNDAHTSHFAARDLRLGCPCATCQDEMTGAPLLDPSSVAPNVTPLAVRLVGSYALRVDWSDGHNTGIYTYEWLLAHCTCDGCRTNA